jgi:hypothetical protein
MERTQIKTSPKFYNSVKNKDEVNLDVIEFINNPRPDCTKNDLKIILLSKEQFHLYKIKLSLNINKVAGSMLRYKYLQKVRDIMSLHGKDKPTNSSIKDLNYIIT